MSEAVGTATGAAAPEVLRVERSGKLTIVTMVYRPYNLLGPKLMGALIRALDEAVGNGSRALVIRSGLRHFSAGADLDLFDDDAAAPQPDEAAAGGGTGSQAVGAVDFLRAFELAPIPIIVSVEGACLGGGLELALACDYIIAAASAKFGSVESALGLHPLMGAVQRQVQRIGMARAKEMSMLGRRYDAATLERWGLINLVVADETLEAATLAIAEEFANGPTIAHAATKKLAYIAANEGVAAADAAMAEIQKPIWASEDLKAGLVSLRKNGPGLARFEGK